MKKSLIAMALMFGAVVFVASCGDDGGDECAKCIVKVTQENGSKVNSLDYTDQPCKDTWTAPSALGSKDAAVQANKGGSYVCE